MCVKKNHLKSMLSMIIMMFIINNNSISANNPQKEASKDDSLSSSVGKWHPKMFYLIYPDQSLKFILPHEPDQSGFYNLFFMSKESGETFLLDTIKDNKRYFTPFSSGNCYDAVLLYNNGKYVRCNDIIFENGAEVDMSNQHIQPYDSVSGQWKTMRYFDDTVIDRTSGRDDIPVLDFIIKGYVLSSSKFLGEQFNLAPTVQLNGSIAKNKKCTSDGYFEIDSEDDSEQTLSFSATLHLSEEINITAPCGIFLVLPIFGAARKVSQ